MRAITPGRRRHRSHDSAPVEPVDELEHSGLDCEPIALDDFIVRGVPACENRIDRITGRALGVQDRRAVVEVAADHAACHRRVERHADRGRRFVPRARGQRLGVEHQAVHVEDHRLRQAIERSHPVTG